MSGCTGLRDHHGVAVLASILDSGEFRVLELCDGSQSPSDDPVLKGVRNQQELMSLAITSYRYSRDDMSYPGDRPADLYLHLWPASKDVAYNASEHRLCWLMCR